MLAYLWWKETGDATVFRGIAQDSIVMNIDDLLCVGVTEGVILSSTINRNAKAIPGAILAELINGTEDVLAMLRAQGFGIPSGGGETADVGDLTPTLTVDSTATAILDRAAVVDAASKLVAELARPGWLEGNYGRLHPTTRWRLFSVALWEREFGVR